MLPDGFQIDGISRTDGTGFLLWDEGSSTRFLLVEPALPWGAGRRPQSRSAVRTTDFESREIDDPRLDSWED